MIKLYLKPQQSDKHGGIKAKGWRETHMQMYKLWK